MSTLEDEHRVALSIEHPVSVGFFDEAGAISSDRFFAVGLLTCPDHADLLKRVRKVRKQFKFWDEFKWATLSKAEMPAYRALFQTLLDSDARFSCFVADRHIADPVARFGDTFMAYEKLATQLVIGSIRPFEIMSVVADNYSAPTNRCFERTVRSEVNRRLERLAVVSVVQVDSHATEGLQLVDMLTGGVSFAFKAASGLAKSTSLKGRVAKDLSIYFGGVDLSKGFEAADGTFSVKTYEHEAWLRRQQNRQRRGKPPAIVDVTRVIPTQNPVAVPSATPIAAPLTS